MNLSYNFDEMYDGYLSKVEGLPYWGNPSKVGSSRQLGA